MTTYRYRGQSLDGAKVTGVIRAYDEFEAVSQLRDRCAFITKIEPVKEKQGNPLTRPVNTRIREKELAMLCSQLSILLSSGLTALRCLQMVAAQTRNKQLRRALEKAAEEVGAGRSMADSLESNREVRFPATFVETVRAGEQSGSLEACLKRLQGYYERSSTARAKVVSAMTYPAMVIVTAIIVVIPTGAADSPSAQSHLGDLHPGFAQQFIAHNLSFLHSSEYFMPASLPANEQNCKKRKVSKIIGRSKANSLASKHPLSSRMQTALDFPLNGLYAKGSTYAADIKDTKAVNQSERGKLLALPVA